jgi:hypothetical protein
MAYLSQFPSAESILDANPVVPRSAGRLPLPARISSIAKWIGDYVEAAAAYYAAAAIYEQLSRLSDAELHRRGLSRAGLAREVSATLDGRARSV